MSQNPSVLRGGAAVISFPRFSLAGSVAGFTREEDNDLVCQVLLNGFAGKVIRGDGLLPSRN